MSEKSESSPAPSLVDKLIRFCLEEKLVVALLALLIIGWGMMVAPFDWRLGGVQRKPVPVDAIPDIGENQQIVFTEWMGRSPKTIDDQITYPLTTSLLGLPGVKTIRSQSMFGFSTIYIIFEEDIEFYWSRSRVLEKLSSLPPGTLPADVTPTLGPDATALGQIFQYTLEGRDPDGKPVGGWDLHELRSVQDWQVRYSLVAASGISEVASIGGFVKEYQVDLNPDAMRAFGVTIEEVYSAIRRSNIDVGAMTIEVNRVEYMIRGLGFIKDIRDIEKTVIRQKDNIPVYVENVANVTPGPEFRTGALDKSGAEAVGGIVVVRFGHNPLEAINNVKQKIADISPSLPTKTVVDFEKVEIDEVRRFASSQGFDAFAGAELNQEEWLRWLKSNQRKDWPAWVTTSQITVVPFYDRTELIHETLGTLNSALTEQVLITVIVIVVLLFNLRSSLLISAMMPLAVLMSFIAMKYFGVDANIVSLSGIAIAIGTIVDMGIVLSENILRHLDESAPEENRLEVVYRASREVGSAVLTAVLTTIVGFLPVFFMAGASGKLFKPLAFTKTFALASSIIIALTLIPAGAHIFFRRRPRESRCKLYSNLRRIAAWVINIAALIIVGVILVQRWMPLGPERGFVRNLIFVALLAGGLLLFYWLFIRVYSRLLRVFLAHKIIFMTLPAIIMLLGLLSWLGFTRVFGFIPEDTRARYFSGLTHAFPGMGREFMPSLDEGSFLLMPTTMPHASIGEALDVIQKQNRAITAIPEVDSATGKIGRAETALDPAPVNMIETIINYKTEYIEGSDGRRLLFRYDKKANEFVRDERGELIPDKKGRPFRQWREHIKTPRDIWNEITGAAEIPGTTKASFLQPIAGRIVMLQTGMRSPLGIKITGPDLESIQATGFEIERLLKEVPAVDPATVTADRIIGKPYLEIIPDREAAARYGISIGMVTDVIEMAIGGTQVTSTVEGRERFPVRLRYQRELRDNIESLGDILVPGMEGVQVPLSQLAKIEYVRGPDEIKSENTFLISYVLFDKRAGFAEVDAVEQARGYLEKMEAAGEFIRRPGVGITFAGTYQNQLQAKRTLQLVLPLSLFIIFMILFFQFKRVLTTGLVFITIGICWGAGFLTIWLYGEPWFMDFAIFGVNMRELFQMHTINLSVAVWVGFLALFGIASDDGVVTATYLDQVFASRKPQTREEIRDAVVEAGARRVRPCIMTTATTVLALLPILTSMGRGSDIMIPMAIPVFGGMFFEVITLFVVPVLYSALKERRFI